MAVLASPIVLIQSVPPITRAFTAITIISSALYGYLSWKGLGVEAVRYMTMVPGFAIYSPWTLLTSAFVETTVFEFVATIIFVPPSLKYLERLWGSLETAKFIVATIVASNIITLAVNCIEFIGTRNADLFLYGMPYHGQMALQIGILVAFTQLIPEHQVQLFGFIKARVKTLPMAYLTLSTVLCLVGYQCPWIIIQFGWYVSWVYLRFYKKNTADTLGGTDTYGDLSETFSLISWFPPFMHYPLTLLGNFVHSLATRLHLIPSAGTDLEHGAYAQVPGTTRAEAERRRAMALKALDQRLANNTSPMNNGSTNAAATQSRAPPVGISPSGSANGSAKDTNDGPKTKSDTR